MGGAQGRNAAPGSFPQPLWHGLLGFLDYGSFRGNIDIDIDVDVDEEVDVDIASYLGCFQAVPKSVQVLLHGNTSSSGTDFEIASPVDVVALYVLSCLVDCRGSQ